MTIPLKMNPQLATRYLYQFCPRVSVCSPTSHYLSFLTFPLYRRSTGMIEGSYKGYSIEWPLTAEQFIKVSVADYLPELQKATITKEMAKYTSSTRSVVSLSSVAQCLVD